MEQNNIWMRYLMLGAICLSVLLSCRKISEYWGGAEFHYINKTSRAITVELGTEAYSLEPYGVYSVRTYQETSKEIDPNNFMPPLVKSRGVRGMVIFDTIKCLEATFDTVHSPFNIKSYINDGRIEKRVNKFTYTFTEEDYNRATACQ